jgi:hypothetical protein
MVFEDSHGELVPKIGFELIEDHLSDQQAMINDAKTKQSLSTGQNRLRRNKGTPGDIVALRTGGNVTQGTDCALL